MARFPHIKLQWGASNTTPGRWYFGLVGVYRRKSGRGKGLAVSLRGVAILAAAAGLVGYFCGAGYYWWKQEQRAYNFVRYSDVLLYPLSAEKRREVRELQGKAMIAEGLDALEAQQWNRALMSLRLGLDRYPRDLTARLTLAQIFLAYRVRAKAQETLLQGLDHGWPGRAYLQSAMEVAAAGDDHELVVTICDRALALHDPARHSDADRRWLVEQRVRALLAEKRSDDALSFAEQEAGAVDDDTLSELRLLALLQAGRFPEAVAFAEGWIARSSRSPQALRLLARAYREAERPDDMVKILAELRAGAPADPRVYVFSLIQHLLAGLEREGRAILEDYIFRFGGIEANFVLAAEPLAEINRPEELEILLAAAAERGMRDPRLAATRLQVLISGRRWAEATRQIADLRTLLPDGVSARANLLDLFQYLVAAAADPADGAQSSLTDYIRARQLPMGVYRQCVETLRKNGRIDTARQILTFAQGVYPTSRYIAETAAALDAEIAERRAAEEAARPVVAAVAAFATPEAFFAEVDRLGAEEGRAAALVLFREMRKARPEWAPSQEEPLGRRELELHAEGDDIAAIQGAVRTYLSADRVRIQHVVALATRFHEAGRDTEARMLLNEILRKVPGDPAASGLLARWFPAPSVDSSESTTASATN